LLTNFIKMRSKRPGWVAGLIHELAMTGKMIVFYCAFGSAGRRARQIEGGMAAWLTAGERGG
jgi:hypothetical protein